ncbi:MAG: hypothetical protein ACKKL4_01505 [Patescibacteria group bacterium]
MSDSGGSTISPKALLVYIALFFAVFYLWLFIMKQDTVGYYFRYADDPTIFEQSAEVFAFRAGCRDWGRSKLYLEDREGDGYACGWNCEYSADADLYICQSYTPIYTK